MAKGNWNANPPMPSGAAQTDKDRGVEGSFNAGDRGRKTGRVGRGSDTANMVPDAMVVPKGKRRI